MKQEMIETTKISKLEADYNKVCNAYGVSCKVLTRNKYMFLDKQEQYLVFGVNGVPDDLDVKNTYVRNERSNALFYTDYFVVKLDENTSFLAVVDAAVSYCKTVEFLRKLFAEHNTKLPLVIRGDEIGGLKEYNAGRNNPALPPEARAKYDKGIKRFFKQEKTKVKYLQNWRAFSRTDKFDRKAPFWKMFSDFSKRNSQITEVDLLHETNDDLKTLTINEHVFIKFRKDMQRLYPDVLYGVSELEVQNEGFDTRNQNKPVEKIQSGPFGKLVTYQMYCEEVEAKFATGGYEAIKELNPAYYETRQLTYKEIDEPYVASVLNSIRFAYAKPDSLQTVNKHDLDVVSYIDVPAGDMMNFVSLAKANRVAFYLDCFGKFGKPNLETIRVIYSPEKDEIMKQIVKRMVNEKFQLSHIAISLEQSSSSLDIKIKEANHLQLSGPEKQGLSHEASHIEL